MARAAAKSDAQEFELSERAFKRVREIVKERSGIDLSTGKRMLVHGRLAKRLRKLGLRTFEEYLTLVEDPQAAEAETFLNSLTTNVTEFFREMHHFEALAKKVLPELLERHEQDRRIRIWSAGCSTGEEPYSIAMVVQECMPANENWDAKILATDIDSNVLAHAQAGVYPDDKVERIGAARSARFLLRGTGSHEGFVRVRPELQKLISFRPLNLMGAWPMRGPMDVIFCRNVIIYFDPETRLRLVARYADLLYGGAHLFLGHSESLAGSATAFEPCTKTMYRKRGTEGPK
jgi:chemotaxis protein methyltransferase CheR